MKALGHNLKVVAALLSLQCIAVAPVYSFWPFKHKSDKQKPSEQTDTPVVNNYPQYSVNQNRAYQNTGYQSPVNHNAAAGKRLVPIYMMNSKNISSEHKTTNIQKVQGSQRTQANSPVVPENRGAQNIQYNQFAQSQNNIQTKSVSNVIPNSSLFSYSKTNIRIAIGLNLRSSKLVVMDGAQLIDNDTNSLIANLPAQSEWVLCTQNNCLTLKSDKDFYIALEQLANTCSQFADTSLSNNTIPANYVSPAAVIANSKGQRLSEITQQQYSNILQMPMNSAGYTIKTIKNDQSENSLLSLNGRVYHGDFLIKPINNSKSTDQPAWNYNVINCLDLEDYLSSVVPSEMPSGWHLEALKAQAIAARSYALANLGKHGSAGYDLKDNIEDQAYSGVKSEADSTNEAVSTTRGLVMKYDGKPICAYFHSCSGGGTERAEHVWHNSVPYLKAVIDFDQQAPLYSWTKNYSILQTESGLPKDIGPVLSISILSRSPSGRAKYILVNGISGSHVISGEAARKYFNLPSTNFNVIADNASYIFTGKGFGHGLGLSQWGAKSLAEHGYNAAQILCYYYDGISIEY